MSNRRNIETTTKYVICSECNGEGFKEKRISLYESEAKTCIFCHGFGRVKEKITKEIIAIEPKH